MQIKLYNSFIIFHMCVAIIIILGGAGGGGGEKANVLE